MSAHRFPKPSSNRLLYTEEEPVVPYPIRHVDIDWERRKYKREIVLENMDHIPA